MINAALDGHLPEKIKSKLPKERTERKIGETVTAESTQRRWENPLYFGSKRHLTNLKGMGKLKFDKQKGNKGYANHRRTGQLANLVPETGDP